MSMWKSGAPGQLTDYAKSIGCTELDGGTARGCYLTVADIKHIRKVLQAVNDAATNDGTAAFSATIRLKPEAFTWSHRLLEYTRGVW